MKILIVDDERHIRESLKKYLSLEEIDAEGAETGEAAVEFLEKEAFDAVILDLKLPGMSGQEVLVWMQRRGLLSPVIMISAHGQISDAVEALKTGACDYLVKPFDPAELIIKLRALVDNRRRENRIAALDRTGDGKTGLIGDTDVMRRLSDRIDKIARSDVTVLITGESGAGKEAVAREIHCRGTYAEEPFAAVNIGGIHEGLMESELFGHEKGSFTGALGRKLGLFEVAGRGTIFLDEIGEMPLGLQVKLLRVLQERKIRRLGGSSDIPVNARIVSATNRDLEAMVREGRFREDLYYRLNVFRIICPPLRERRDDIPPLTEFLLNKLSTRMGRPHAAISPGALEKLLVYDFPGNIRELENILERALIYGEGNRIEAWNIELHKSDASLAGDPAAATSAVRPEPSAASSLEAIEKQAIADALVRCQGNRSRASVELGICRKTLLNKIKLYALE
ncbi:MAG: sigma-54 dependent transcriptional regulator [Treponema sp.]|jgi:two-component system response regulator AtoC|nr:sigma-54 dependent transcriptional regulator [Treponema sp.]